MARYASCRVVSDAKLTCGVPGWTVDATGTNISLSLQFELAGAGGADAWSTVMHSSGALSVTYKYVLRLTHYDAPMFL